MYCDLLRRIFILSTALFLAHTNISAAGARLIADLNPGPVGSYPSNFTSLGDTLYFTAYTQSNGFELFRLDANTITLAAEINPTVDDIGFGVFEGNDSFPTWLTPWNGSLYFSAFEPRRGGELWRYDGTNATRISDINPDANDAIKLMPGNSWPQELTILNNAIYFSATSRTNPENYELWKFDGTAVTQAANIHSDIAADYSSYPNQLTAFNGALYFMANDGATGYELHVHDGTSTRLIDLNPGGTESSSYPKLFVPFGANLYFQAYTDAAGFELWRTDGTTATIVTNLNDGAESSFPQEMIVFQNALYFTATNSLYGTELWRFDGTNVSLAADINPSGDSFPKSLIVFGDSLLFSATDGVNGWELWKFDGSTATMITNLNPSGDSFPENLTISGNSLFFAATTPETGYEVFEYDNATVSLAADINPGPADSFPKFLYTFQNQLYFSATTDGASNWELWVLDVAAPVDPAPAITSITRDGSSIMITASGPTGATAALQASTNLEDWQPVTTTTFANGTATFTQPADGQMQFFQVSASR